MAMTIRRLSACFFLLVAAALSTSCQSREEIPLVSATISNENGDLMFEVVNGDTSDLMLDKAYAISDKAGGGNLLLIPIRKEGLLYRACANIDYGPEYRDSTPVAPGMSVKSPVIQSKLLKQLYCLPEGEYELSALYFDKRGNRIHSNTLLLSVP